MAEMVDFGYDPTESLDHVIVLKGEKLLTCIKEEKTMSKEKEGKSAKPMMYLEFVDETNPEADKITEYILLPHPELSANMNKDLKARWRDFCLSFGLQFKHDPDATAVNRPKGWAFIKHEEFPEGSGKMQAKIARFIVQAA